MSCTDNFWVKFYWSSGDNDTKSGNDYYEVCVCFYEKNVANELAKVGAPQADKDSSNYPENFHINVFLAKSFDWNTLYSYGEVINESFLVVSMHTIRQNM